MVKHYLEKNPIMFTYMFLYIHTKRIHDITNIIYPFIMTKRVKGREKHLKQLTSNKKEESSDHEHVSNNMTLRLAFQLRGT